MTIRWNNVIALILAVVAIAIAVRFHEPIGRFLDSIEALGNRRGDDRYVGLIALAVVAASALGALRILFSNRRNKP